MYNDKFLPLIRPLQGLHYFANKITSASFMDIIMFINYILFWVICRQQFQCE